MDPMKHWQLRLWQISCKISRPLLRAAEAVDDFGSRTHAKWREKVRCTFVNENGERCLLIPGPGGCGYMWPEGTEYSPHWFDSQFAEKPWENKLYSISRSTRVSKLSLLFFSWRRRDFVPIYATYDGVTVGHRVIAWAVAKDAPMITDKVEPIG